MNRDAPEVQLKPGVADTDAARRPRRWSLVEQAIVLLFLGVLLFAGSSVSQVAFPFEMARRLEAGVDAYEHRRFEEASPLIASVLVDEPRSLRGRIYSICTAWKLGYDDNAVTEFQAALLSGLPVDAEPSECGFFTTRYSEQIILADGLPLVFASGDAKRELRLEASARALGGNGNTRGALLVLACLNHLADFKYLAAGQLSLAERGMGAVPTSTKRCLDTMAPDYLQQEQTDGTRFFYPRDLEERLFIPEEPDGA